MESKESSPLCRLCGKPLGTRSGDYDFGGPDDVHWICYHFVVEHTGNPDEPCAMITCPLFTLEAYYWKLGSLGVDQDDVVEEAIQKRIAARKGSA